MADQGVHVFDGIHLLMNASYATAVNASAGRIHKDRVDTPESVVVIAEYPEDFVAVFSINYAAMHYESRNDQLNQLDGDQARLDVGRVEFKVFLQGKDDQPESVQHSELGFGHATDLHVANFLECVKTRQTPTAPIRLGFQAALVTQMGNLSLNHGRRLRWNPQTNTVEG
jgi:predicted dehydrogenase